MRTIYLIGILLVINTFISCEKYLEKKPDVALVVPQTVQDVQRLLDRNDLMNVQYAGTGEASADNYYLLDADWAAMSEGARNMYVWGEELFFDQLTNDWSRNYAVVYYANTVLEHLEVIPRTSQNAALWDNAKGSALFFRAVSFYRLLGLFSLSYDTNSAETDAGIVLRLNTDFNEVSIRSSVQRCYEQVVYDFTSALNLLPVIPSHKLRPSKPAAFAFLAKTYLVMGDFQKAGNFADSCLQYYNTLLDYNTVNSSASFPFSIFNPEVIWHSHSLSIAPLSASRAKIDSSLYNSYAFGDRRKLAFFRSNGNGTYAYKGSYSGDATYFTGIGTDEVYLIRAECFARNNRLNEAINDLNTLLSKRWTAGQFTPLTVSSQQAVVGLVLSERRKEMVYRDIRFSDIKRLNKLGAGIAITRKLNNSLLVLPPGDNRFALPIPYKVIEISGISQNPR